MMLRILLALMVALAGLAFVAPPSASAACIDAVPDDDGVGLSCNVPVFNETCTLRAGEYGDPNPLPSGSCDVIPIECVREPCP